MNYPDHAIHGDLDRQARPRRRVGWVAAVGLALALLASACGGDDEASPAVASVETTAPDASDPSSPTGSEPATPDPVAYAQCMRDEGVPGFPDPTPDGDFSISANQLGVPPDSPQYLDAEKTCAPLMPQRSDEQEAEDYGARLEYASCMRDEGITGFPDPPAPSDGPVSQENSGDPSSGGLAFEPGTPQFDAAHDACKDNLPEGDAGGSGSQAGG